MHIQRRFLLSILTLAFLPFLASAQEASGLRLVTSPLPVTVSTQPGKSVTTDIKVKNDGTAPEELQLKLMKFRAYEDSGKPALEEPDGTEDFLKWVSFSEPRFALAPNEWKTVSITFAPPETAALGYYYAFVFSRAEEQTATSDGQTALTGGSAILVLLDVEVPNAKKEITLESFSADHSFYEFLPVNFSVRLKNIGNIHTAPRGNIFISRVGQEAALVEVNLEKGNILPGSERVFETSWEDGFPHYIPKTENGAVVRDEEGNTTTELTWNWADAAKLRFGKYTAKLVMVYDNGERDVPLEQEVTFWVLPWRLILGGIAVPVIPSALVYFFMKRRMKKYKKSLETKK
jgi:hypothetical protein